MAQNRRMFSSRITYSARFLQMSPSAQSLYFHLAILADDDGIVEAFTVMRTTKALEDDFRVLVMKGFIKPLNEDLVSYILDWNEHNSIRPDRIIPSVYRELLVEVLPDVKLVTPKPRADTGKLTGQPLDVQWTTQDRIGKDNTYTGLRVLKPASEGVSDEEITRGAVGVEGEELEERRLAGSDRRQKNVVAMKVVRYFHKKAEEYTGKQVISGGYGAVDRLLKSKKVTEKDLMQVIDDFFDSVPPDNKAGNIYVCMSARNVNKFLAEK